MSKAVELSQLAIPLSVNDDGNVAIDSSVYDWDTTSGRKALQLGDGFSIYNYSNSNLHLLQNAYYDGGWKHSNSVAATNLYIGDNNVQIRRSTTTASAGASLSWDNMFSFDTASTRLGIGESQPDTSLHIKKNQSSGASSIKLENSAGGNDSSFDIDWQLASSGTSARIRAVRTNDPAAGDTDLVFSTSNNGTSVYDRLTIKHDGKIGIGVSNPVENLEISGTIASTGGAYSSNTDYTYLVAGTTGYTGANTNWNTFGFQHKLKSDSAGVPRIAVETTNGEVFNIRQDGFVGLGTSDPIYTLHVSDNSGSFAVNTKTSTYPRLLVGSSNGGTTGLIVNRTVGSQNIIFGEETDTGSVQIRYDGGGPNGLRVTSRVNRAKIQVADNDTTAYIIAEDGYAMFGRSDSLAGNNLKLNSDGDVYAKRSYNTEHTRHNLHPTLNLDFVNSKELDSRITFYRDSVGTYFDAKGILRYANHNQPRFDHDPVTGDCKGLLIEEDRQQLIGYSNPIIDNDFVSIGNGSWQNAGGNSELIMESYAAVAPDGTFTATHLKNLNNSNTDPDLYLYHSFDFPASSTVTHSIWIKAPSDAFVGKEVEFRGKRIGGTASSWGNKFALTNEWQRVEVTNTYNADNTTARIYIGSRSNYAGMDPADEVLVWGGSAEIGQATTSYIPSDVKFASRASMASYYDENGTVRYAPMNVARYSHGWDGRKYVPTGLFVENTRTNSAKYSDAQSNWSVPNNSYTYGSSVIAPDGTRIRAISRNAEYNLMRGANAFDNTITATYTISMWLKSISGGTSIGFDMGDNVNASGSWTITTEWQRYTKTVTYTANATIHSFLDINVPTNTEVAIWGIQVEIGDTASSYIPTFGSSVTRAADITTGGLRVRENDIVEITDAEDIIPQPLGTVYTEWATNEPAGQFAGIFEMLDSGTEGIDHRITGSAVQYYIGNNNSVSAGGAHVAGEYRKTALAYDLDSIVNSQAVSEGQLQGANTAHIWDFRMKKIRLGSIDVNPAYQLNGYIKSFRLYEDRFDNAELKGLTEND